jgi:peptide/nickel transport system substrate-binding protein
MRNLRRQGVVALGLAGLLAGTAACGSGDSGDDGPSDGGKSGGTLVFGTSADPVSMDGAYVSDGESLRVVRQLFETLVTTEPGGTEIVPGLAKEWESTDDGKKWTFTLQDGVKFHDGTDFNAEAVCANFDRWYNFKGVQQSASVSYYWQTVFTGYAKNEDPSLGTSLYQSCEAADGKAVINLTSRPPPSCPAWRWRRSRSPAPRRSTKFEADKVTGTGEEPRFEGTFGTQNPIGTGPFKLETYEPNNRLVLARFDDYWGDKSKLDKVIFKPIADGPARRQALEAGEIQGYDLVDPADLGAPRGRRLPDRRAPGVQRRLRRLQHRQEAVRQPEDPPGRSRTRSTARRSSRQVPARRRGGQAVHAAEPVRLRRRRPEYEYSVEKAKALIAESGVTNPTSSSGTRPASAVRTCRTRPPTSRRSRPT